MMKLRLNTFLAMCFMLAALIGCKDDAGTGAITDKLTDEFMNSFRSPGEISHHYRGHSSAIDITPDVGMHVSAPENAFSRETKISVTGVSDKEFEAIDKTFEPAHVEPLLAYHLDAGLGDDEVMPCVYQVEFDLKKLDIPESLWSRLSCYRVSEDGKVTEFASVVKDGKLIYESSQNSVAVVGLLKWFGPWFAKAVGVRVGIYTAIVAPIYYGVFGLIRYNGMPKLPEESSSWIQVTDVWGKFTLYYDQQESENRDASPKDKNGNSKMKKAEEKYKELKEKAEQEYERRIEDAGKNDNPSWLGNIVQSHYQKEEAKKRISQDDILDELAKKDSELQLLLLDKFFQTPQSVNDVIDMQCLCNRYLCDKQELKKTWYRFDVFLAGDVFMNEKSTSTMAYAMAYDGFFTYICLRNSKIIGFGGKKYFYNKENVNEMLVTMCHETFHMKQYHYIASTNLTKDDRLCEATAIILERQFADYLEAQGLSDPKKRADLALTSCEGREWLSWTLEKPLPASSDDGDNPVSVAMGAAGLLNCDIGYMLGEFVQFLLDTKDSKVTLKKIWENYDYSLGFHGMLMKDFGFKSDSEFSLAYENFCKKNMKKIVSEQVKPNNMAYKRGLLDKPVVVSPRYSVHRFSNLSMNVKGHGAFSDYTAGAYATKVFQFVPHKDCAKLKYNTFIYPSPVIGQGMLKTVVLDSKYNYNDGKPFFAEIKTSRTDSVVPSNVVLFYRPNISGVEMTNDWWVDVVTLFEPEEKPVVRADDKENVFVVDTRVRPENTIVQKGYVSGLEILARNVKTGRKYVKRIENGECGKSEEILYRNVGVSELDRDYEVSFATRWYYRNEEQKLYYYSPYTDSVTCKREREPVKEEPVKPEEDDVTESKPMKNTGIDADFRVTYFWKDDVGDAHDTNRALVNAYNENEVIGHVTLNKTNFTLTVPAHNLKWGDYTFEIPGVIVTSTPVVTVIEGANFEFYNVNLDKLSVSPSTLVFKEYMKRPDSFFKEGYLYINTTMKCVYEGNGGKDWFTGDDISGGSSTIRLAIPTKTRYIHKDSNNDDQKKDNNSVEKEPGSTGYRHQVEIRGKVIK